MGVIYWIIICLALIGFTSANDVSGCESPQYLGTGKRATVSCSFEDGFFSVYWYDSKNYVTAEAIIEYQDSVKRGKGFVSGEFDVYHDGSLIINNVSLAHDHYFTVVEVRSVDNYNLYHVRVIATVKPTPEHPVIENCDTGRTLCYKKLPRGAQMECFIRDSRPNIMLTWVSGTKNVYVQSESSETSSGLLTTSIATTQVPSTYSSGIHLLLCKADDPHELLMYSAALILVESDVEDLNSITPISKYVETNSKLNLSCSENEITFLVWKHHDNTDENFWEIAYGVYWQASWSTFASEGYNVTDSGDIFISELRPEHEGQYACISSNGTDESIIVYDITAYVPPDPAFLVVEGCSHDQYCVLETGLHGTLKCSVKGIRPKVILSWRTFHDRSSNQISFHNQETAITRREDGTFDVLLTAQFDASRAAKTTLTIECSVAGEETKIFPLNTKLDLLFIEGQKSTTTTDVVPKGTDGKQQRLLLIIILTVVISVILVASAVFLFIRGTFVRGREPQTEVEKDTTVPMLPVPNPGNTLSENLHKGKHDLVKQLKSKYEDLTAAVYPVPYLREKMYSINDVFVESRFDYLVSGGTWKTFNSYHEIFNDPQLASSRRIIEGEAGYGKSMLSLKFAYDWCNNIEGSPLNQDDIFILLQLRQLGGVKSIFDAIKQCLLPKDTYLTSTDIERILQESKSVLIVLDGYDEYPDEDKGNDSFVINILNRDIMQQYDVILTTRSFCLPKTFSPLTKKITLRGFDEISRELYLRKVFVGDDKTAIEKIKEKMRENPFLEDICQVPLFYVLFAHLSTLTDTLIKFNSVTVFFRHIISCFHAHSKNKITDSVAKLKFQSYERSHDELDKIAFDGLSGKSKQLIWEKDYIYKRLGQEFYKQYTDIGVLVEEEVLNILDSPGHVSTQHIQYKQEVRFYHKLFCEWYAAHYLAKYAAEPEVTLDPRNGDLEGKNSGDDIEMAGPNLNSTKDKEQDMFENLDPANVQYLYRFACGINETAAEKIYQYITSKYGGDKFAILCLVEQTGNLQKIKPTIDKICATAVMFHQEHSILLQRSTIQILEIASLQQIPISNLWICNCFEKVNHSSTSLRLTSGIQIRHLNTLSALEIRENDRKMTEKETVRIFNYCVQNRGLTTLKFKYCLMPWSIPPEEMNLVQKRKITVLWDTGLGSLFELNLENGTWQHENGSGPLKQEEYDEEALTFQTSES